MAAQAGLCLPLSETPEDTFCRVVAHLHLDGGFLFPTLVHLNVLRVTGLSTSVLFHPLSGRIMHSLGILPV